MHRNQRHISVQMYNVHTLQLSFSKGLLVLFYYSFEMAAPPTSHPQLYQLLVILHNKVAFSHQKHHQEETLLKRTQTELSKDVKRRQNWHFKDKRFD